MKKIKNIFKPQTTNNINDNQVIEILFRLYCFQEVSKNLKQDFNESKSNEKQKVGYFLNKLFLQNYKYYFDYQNFVINIKKNTILNSLKDGKGNINYNLFVGNENSIILNQIIEEFINNNKKFIQKINKQNKNIKSNKLLKDEPCKIITNALNIKNLKYIEEFELIPQTIYSLIQKQLSFGNFAYICQYIIEKDYIFFFITTNTEYSPIIMEIGKFLNNNTFKVKYIIKYADDNSGQNIFNLLGKDGIGDMLEYFDNNNKNGNIYLVRNFLIKYYNLTNINIKDINDKPLSPFTKNENLFKISLLYHHYHILDNKIFSNEKKQMKNFDNIYLVNYKPLQDIKIDLDYKIMKDEFEKNDNIKNIFLNTNQNFIDINDLIKLLPKELIQKYKDIIINKQNKDTNIEPNMIAKNITQNEQIFIFDKFEILDKKLLRYFFPNFDNLDNIKAECSYAAGKLIINLPKYLNQNKFVTLIGSLDLDYKQFICSYILVYDSDISQNKHINFILNNLEQYLDTIKGDNSQIVFEGKQIGIITKNKEEEGVIIIPPIIKKEVKKEHPKIGLQNIGATCYMNATLQCFAHIKDFVRFFKKGDKHLNVLNNPKTLSYSFKILIDKLWPEENEIPEKLYYAPYDFKEKISTMNPLFKGIAANDSKDLINFIVMTLHEELNEIKNDIIINNQEVDQRNKEAVFEEFRTDYIKRYNSIASTLFYGSNYSVSQCTQCNIKLYNYQVFFFIIFPLEEVRKFKQQLNLNNNINIAFNNNNMNNVVDIFDCFEFDRRVTLMSGDNSMFCNNCQTSNACRVFTNLVFGPNILIIILNRGKGKEFDVKLNFGEDLNLDNYIEKKETGVNYKLIGVITHLGESGMGGHFIAFCKDPISLKWYKFNDAFVSPVEDFKKEVIDFGMNYLLFYQKTKN